MQRVTFWHNSSLTPAFDSQRYGPEVAAILALDGNGQRLAPLAIEGCSSSEARERMRLLSPSTLFGESAHPDAALGGLYLYFSCFDEAHSVVQDLHTPEGSFWHAILHRQEPDAFNSGYWFRQVGAHPIYPLLLESADEIGSRHTDAGTLDMKGRWDPLRFIDYCEAARKHPGSADETFAREVQRAEWQLLFHYCAERTR